MGDKLDSSPASDGSTPSCAVVIGAGGGIGAALTGSLKESDRYSDIFAFARGGDWATDITREDSVAAAAARVAATAKALRLIVIASGFLHDEEVMPERSWRDLLTCVTCNAPSSSTRSGRRSS